MATCLTQIVLIQKQSGNYIIQSARHQLNIIRGLRRADRAAAARFFCGAGAADKIHSARRR